MMPISMGIERMNSGMGCPFELLGGNLHGVGGGDGDDDDLGAGGKLLLRGNGLVFDSAIELVHLDFADAGLVALAERLNIRQILSIDKHFRIYRPRHCDYFDVIP